MDRTFFYDSGRGSVLLGGGQNTEMCYPWCYPRSMFGSRTLQSFETE